MNDGSHVKSPSEGICGGAWYAYKKRDVIYQVAAHITTAKSQLQSPFDSSRHHRN
ncbi:hypothetical protein CCACVL1_06768 [Corchorus capsularis]|uniref:Uncharacterized protein n=1 Tax=Corchorus capsularis TaxID=210143 RepID=A0A1R3JD17_COCAP|nr:hypothetical protein CCACVL1_06768 [Corchorus capsularis]